ncbi:MULTISPECIES: hypothetical protein [Pandoraea]|uniref:Uncharacterized protein n=1 Tax=Pandoraea communis TaxID=2508297 RepID=A0A5E4YHS6_9BURK|nr:MULTISPECIES: hypothetical protein [Pandoraea]VVE47603.1 hypothetical protein PCO31110_04555 [Pandoraea communis]
MASVTAPRSTTLMAPHDEKAQRVRTLMPAVDSPLDQFAQRRAAYRYRHEPLFLTGSEK